MGFGGVFLVDWFLFACLFGLGFFDCWFLVGFLVLGFGGVFLVFSKNCSGCAVDLGNGPLLLQPSFSVTFISCTCLLHVF